MINFALSFEKIKSLVFNFFIQFILLVLIFLFLLNIRELKNKTNNYIMIDYIFTELFMEY